MSNKIKILHIIPIYTTGGAERLVLHYARLLDKDKYEIHVASCVEDGELREKFEKLNNIHVYVGSRTKDGGRLKAYGKLWQYTKDIQPDIIHTHILAADFFGFFVKLKLGKKIKWISTQHNVEASTSTLRKILWRFILKFADSVVAVSKSVEKFTIDNFKVKKEKCELLLNGIDTENWLKVPLNKLFTHDKIQLASVGRLWEQKGHTYLLQALSKLNFVFELHLFGDGPLRERLELEAKNLQINDNIVWHGVTPNVVDYMRDIDIVIQASLWEGLSLVVMEMMSSGRVVVATPPAGEELMVDQKTGYLVPSKNSVKLAEKLVYIVENREEAKAVALEARKVAKENFDIMKNVQGLENIYDKLAKN